MVDLPVSVQERLQTIVQQSARASDLIQQILDFSRRSILERLPLDLAPFVKGLVGMLKRTLPEHIQIELVSSEDGFLIHADPSRIQQVVMNLAVNARDAMPEGGRLKIKLATVQTEAVTPLLTGDLPAGEWVLVQVADSGSGIPPEAMLQIFEPFFTTKAAGQGTGLGLAQVYGIVRQHDGFIDVRTTVGEGTTFSLYFPVLEGDANLKNPLNMDSLKVGQGQTILLVEDNPITRQAFVDSLILLNYEVIEATNGREALAILEARGDDIDLVLSDAVMPEMGGIALWHAMRQQELVRPMILTSGHPLDKEIGELQKLGLAGWLPKPPELTRLSQLLAQVLAT
jgi:CheY-like chemotaxis protein